MQHLTIGEISFRAGHSGIAGGCASPSCTIAEAAADPLVAIAAVLTSVTLLLAFAYVRDAREACRFEQERTRAESEAFGRFGDRVSALEAGGTELATNGATQSLASARRDARLDKVRNAYRDTVMDVDHYDEDYGDSLPQSMAEEFGVDVAAAVCRGDVLSQQLQQTIVARTATAESQRDELDEAVEEELASLDRAEARLERIERQRRNLVDHVEHRPEYEALADVWRRLGELEDRVTEVIAERQADLNDPPMKAWDDLPKFQEYLYESLEVDYPVLAAAAELIESVRRDRKRVLESLATTG